ncbi:hypothetical protein BC629DRAFT_26166 [Irpex lacteus]|nr:hypothetical protein BC629DRAFT_26166 [Irpex lacteus]
MLMIHTFLMFAISTAHVVVILDYNFTIFLYHNAAVEGDVVPSYDVVIWRVWVIWGRNKKATAAPALAWLAGIVTFIGSAHALALPGGLGLGNGLNVSPWVAAFMGFTLLTNFTAVIAISYRFWLYRKEVSSVLGQGQKQSCKDCRVSTILALIIESGSLYCVTWVSSFIHALRVHFSKIVDRLRHSCSSPMLQPVVYWK